LEDVKLVKDYEIKEGGFMVLMVTKVTLTFITFVPYSLGSCQDDTCCDNVDASGETS
jgi:hypothetical protein